MRKKWGLGICLLGALILPPAMAQTGQDYLCDQPMGVDFYQFFRWQAYEMPLKVYIPSPGRDLNVENPGMYVPIVKQAFQAWMQVEPKLQVTYVNDPAQAQIVVKWRSKFEHESAWGKAMLPNPYQGRNGKIYHRSVIHLAVRAQEGTGLTPGEPLFSAEELQAIAIHEAGHALGLPHSNNREDIMTGHIFRLTADYEWKVSPRDAATLRRIFAFPAQIEIPPCNGGR